MTTAQFNSKEPIKAENLMYVPFGEILAMLKNGYKIEGISIATTKVEKTENQSVKTEENSNINTNQFVRQMEEKAEVKITKKTVKKKEKTEKKQPKKVVEEKKTEKISDTKILKTKKQKSIRLF